MMMMLLLHIPDVQQGAFEGGLRLPDPSVPGAHVALIGVLGPQAVLQEVDLRH